MAKSSSQFINVLFHLLGNAERPASYSDAFVLIYQRGENKQLNINISRIDKKHLCTMFEHDFRVPTKMFIGMSRSWMFKYLRKFLFEYPGFQSNSKCSQDGLWQYIVTRFRSLLNFQEQNLTSEVIDLCSENENEGDEDSEGTETTDTAAAYTESEPVCRAKRNDESAVDAAADATLNQLAPVRQSTNEKPNTTNGFKQMLMSGKLKLADILNVPNKMLTLCSTSSQEIYSLKLRRSGPASLDYNFESAISRTATAPIGIQQLLQTPAIGMNIDLDSVTCWRCIRPNYERHIVLGPDALNAVYTGNDTRPRRQLTAAAGAETPPPHPLLSKQVFKTYLNLMLHCLADKAVNLLAVQSAALHRVFELLLDELDDWPQLRLSEQYARFPSTQRFARVFAQDDAVATDDAVCVRETCNPELEFRIDACPFECGTAETGDWPQRLHDYFDRVLVQRDERALAKLRHTFVWCLRFECTECALWFDGPSALISVLEHVRIRHAPAQLVAGSSRWQCVQCAWQMPAPTTTDGRRWEHRCAMVAAAVTVAAEPDAIM